MSANDLFRLLVGRLAPGEERTIAQQQSDAPLTDDEAEALLEQLRGAIAQNGYDVIVGPKLFRETIHNGNGSAIYYTHAVAIMRKPQ
jgi:hypothetical protein